MAHRLIDEYNTILGGDFLLLICDKERLFVIRVISLLFRCANNWYNSYGKYFLIITIILKVGVTN